MGLWFHRDDDDDDTVNRKQWHLTLRIFYVRGWERIGRINGKGDRMNTFSALNEQDK